MKYREVIALLSQPMTQDTARQASMTIINMGQALESCQRFFEKESQAALTSWTNVPTKEAKNRLHKVMDMADLCRKSLER